MTRYENGKQEFERQYGPKDKPVGEWLSYYQNGVLREKQGYDIAGKLSGTKISYDSLENKLTEDEYAHGLKTGKSKTFHPNGKVNEVFIFQGNYIQGEFKAFHPKGKIHIAGLYKNSRKNGKWTFTNEEGAQYKIETWRNGKLLSTKSIKFKK